MALYRGSELVKVGGGARKGAFVVECIVPGAGHIPEARDHHGPIGPAITRYRSQPLVTPWWRRPRKCVSHPTP